MARNIDYVAVQRDRDPQLRTGALVRIKPGFEARSRHTRPGAVMVAIADKFDIVNCMEVGGGTGTPGRAWDPRAYARIPAVWLQVIDPAGFASAEFCEAAGLTVYADHRDPDEGATLTEVPPPVLPEAEIPTRRHAGPRK